MTSEYHYVHNNYAIEESYTDISLSFLHSTNLLFRWSPSHDDSGGYVRGNYLLFAL